MKPNILWISLEDTSPRFGCYGDSVARTPNIDRLAAGGCRFPNAFSTAGVCAPSRSAIITGTYQTSIGTHHMRTTHEHAVSAGMPTPYHPVPPPYVKCFSEYFRTAGYFCTNNQKTDYQFEVPISAWDQQGAHGHWRNRDEGQSFLSVFNPTITHESGMWVREQHQTDPDSVTLPPYLPDTEKSRIALAKHYDNLADADRQVGELLDQLDADGLTENTIVVLWSDHGEGLPRAKRWPYDAGINIPLIVRYPGHLEPGSVSDQLVSLVDLAPTMLSLCGLPIPSHMQGQPFMGPKMREREFIFASRDRHDESYDMVRAARSARFKYIRNFYPGMPYFQWIPYRNQHPVMQEIWRLHAAGELTGPQQVMFQERSPEELYDIQDDPYELNNLASSSLHQKELARMREAMDDWRQQYGDWGDVGETQMVRHMWPGGEQPTTSTPIVIPLSEHYSGRETWTGSEHDVKQPTHLQLHCATQGASIVYTFDDGDDAAWQLYHHPLALESGATTLRIRAARLGYTESAECQIKLRVVD